MHEKTPQGREQILSNCAHEFGHTLGIMDAYGYNNKYNYYMEPVSYGEIIYDEIGLVGYESSGEMMHRSGKVSVNDIEMAIYARKTAANKKTGDKNKGYQFYIPVGYTVQESIDGSQSEVRYSLSKAIRCEYFYKYDVNDSKKDYEVEKALGYELDKGCYYYYDKLAKQYKKVNADGSNKIDIKKSFIQFDEEYYNYVIIAASTNLTVKGEV